MAKNSLHTRSRSNAPPADEGGDAAAAPFALPSGVREFYGLVQRKAESAGPGEREIHEAARAGTTGPAGPLPFLGEIQKSFGSHDVSHVRAHTDSRAQAGSRAMAAEAFAVGDHVAFGGAPSLRTAAHEAAHVVQQKGGVQLSGGVGADGDAWERHADAVADKVVRGESTQGLLDEVAGSGTGQSAPVQRMHEVKGTQPTYQKTQQDLTSANGLKGRDENSDFNEFVRSDTQVFITPRHDATGWGFFVRENDAEKLRLELEARGYPGIKWEVRKQGIKVPYDPTVYVLIRPVQDDSKLDRGMPAMSPGDCLQKCMHTMNVQHIEAFYKGEDGQTTSGPLNDPFLAKCQLMEGAFKNQIDPQYWKLKEEYLISEWGRKSELQKLMDPLVLAPYAALNEPDKDRFDRDHEINRYAKVSDQQGFMTLSDSGTAKKDYAFHAGGVLKVEGNDVVTWENFANWANEYGKNEHEKKRPETDYAVFKMYSTNPKSGKTFHDQIALDPKDGKDEYGVTPITMSIRGGQPPQQVNQTTPTLNTPPPSPVLFTVDDLLKLGFANDDILNMLNMGPPSNNGPTSPFNNSTYQPPSPSNNTTYLPTSPFNNGPTSPFNNGPTSPFNNGPTSPFNNGPTSPKHNRPGSPPLRMSGELDFSSLLDFDPNHVDLFDFDLLGNNGMDEEKKPSNVTPALVTDSLTYDQFRNLAPFVTNVDIGTRVTLLSGVWEVTGWDQTHIHFKKVG